MSKKTKIKNTKTEKTDTTKANLKSGKNNVFSNLKFDQLAIAVSVLYFIILLIASFSAHKIGDYGVESDFFGAYVPQAQKFMDGELVIDKYKGPGYIIILGLFNVLTQNYFTAGILIGIISAVLSLLLTYFIVKKLFNEKVALITTLLMAVNTTYVLYTYSAGTDMFFVLLVTAALYFLFKNKEFKWQNMLLAGVFTGFAYITRYNGIFMFVTIVAAVFLINIYKTTWGKRIIATLIFAGTFAAVIAPWGIYTYKEKGKAFFNQNYQNVAYEYYAKPNGISWNDYWYQGERDKFESLRDVIFSDFGGFFSQFISNVFSHIGQDLGSLMGWHIGIFSLIGLILMFYHPPTKFQWAYYLANLLFFGVLLLAFYNERFSMFLIPFYAVFGVNLLFSENKLLKKSLVKSNNIQIILAAILIVWTFVNCYKYNSENINTGDQNLEKIAKQFKQVETEETRGDRITARKGHIAYYLGVERKYLKPEKDYFDLVAKMWKHGVDYAYFDQMTGGSQYLVSDMELSKQDFDVIAQASSKNKFLQRKFTDKKPYVIDKVKKQTSSAVLFKIKIDSIKQSLIDMGDWMVENVSDTSKKKLCVALPYLAYYAEMKHVQLPQVKDNQGVIKHLEPDPFEDFINKLKSKNVNYLYIGIHEASYRRFLQELLVNPKSTDQLELLHEVNKSSDHPGVLYKIK
jgi:hypothetical protein